MKAKLNLKQALMAALYAGGSAAVVNAILYFLFHAMDVITDDIMVQPDQSLTVAAVLVSSIFPLLIGGILFYLLEKYTANGFKIFSIVALLFAAMSMYAPFAAIPGVTTAYALALCALHIPPVVFILYFINRAKTTGVQA